MNKHVRRSLVAVLALGLLFLVAAGSFQSAAANPPGLSNALISARQSLGFTFHSLLPSFASPACGAGVAVLSTNSPDAVLAGSRSFGGPASDMPFGIEPTADGGYLVAGYTMSFGVGQADAWVIKLDHYGRVLWQKALGGNLWDDASSIRPTRDGGYVMAGSTNSFGAGLYDVWVLKLDGSGNVLWQKTFGGNSYDTASSIRPTRDGGYIVAGETQSFGWGHGDGWVLKLDGSGNVIWQKTYGDMGWDDIFSITPSGDGGYVMAGLTTSFGAGGSDAWVVKLDALGNILWQKTYGGADDEEARAVAATKDGGTIVAGFTASFGAGNADAWVLKLDGSGQVQWQKALGGLGDDFANSVVPTADGGYVVAGDTHSFGPGLENAWVFKLDGAGNMVGEKTYGGGKAEFAKSIATTPDGGFVATGGAQSFGAGDKDFWVLKLDSRGNLGKNCSIVGSSSATVIDTTVAAADAFAMVSDTTVIGVDSNATVTDTNAQIATQCPR